MLIVLLVTACASEKTALQEATGATNSQAKYLEDILAEYNVAYENVTISDNPIVDGMDTNWQAYDLTDEDGNTHVLILQKSNNALSSILDSEGRLIFGLADNGVTPTLFENGEYKFNDWLAMLAD